MRAADSKTRIGDCALEPTVLGYGGGGISNMYAAVSEEDALESVNAAWDAGIRLFDTAPFYGYGLAERRMGNVLSGKPRDQFLLSTKVGRLLVPRRDQAAHPFFPESPMPFNPVFDYSYDGTMRSFEDSLQRLGMDRIDVVLIHDVGPSEHGDAYPQMLETALGGAARALVELREQKVVGAIGLGVNDYKVCLDFMEKVELDVFLLAGRYSLLEHEDVHANFLPRLAETKIKLLIGGPFNSGILAAERAEQNYYNYARASDEMVAKVAQLREKCAQQQVDIKTAALRFPYRHPAVASVLFGARSAAELNANVAAFDSRLPTNFWEDMELARYRS